MPRNPVFLCSFSRNSFNSAPCRLICCSGSWSAIVYFFFFSAIRASLYGILLSFECFLTWLIQFILPRAAFFFSVGAGAAAAGTGTGVATGGGLSTILGLALDLRGFAVLVSHGGQTSDVGFSILDCVHNNYIHLAENTLAQNGLHIFKRQGSFQRVYL